MNIPHANSCERHTAKAPGQVIARFTFPWVFLIPFSSSAQEDTGTNTDHALGNSVLEAFVGPGILAVDPGQWMALAALMALALIAGAVLARIVSRIALSVAGPGDAFWDRAQFGRVAAPTRLAASVAILYAGIFALQLPEPVHAVIAICCKILAVASVAWFLSRLVDLFAVYVETRLSARGNTASIAFVPLGRRVAKAFIYTLAALTMLQNLGFNIGGLLAGLGIGGLAVALAAQKTLENLFGGFVLVADRPFRIGEFCRAGEHLGTIENVGMRSSRIRTPDRTLVTVPNAELSTVRIENYGARDMMRLHTVLQVGYDTSPDQMRYLLVELRRMLYAHPKTLPNPCRVRFINFGSHSLDIEIFVYIETTDWNEFTGIREDIHLRILDIVADSGACFAYPSQTLYIGRDAGRDKERTASTEAIVGQWRSDGKLPIPEFPESMIAEVDGTLDYPPAGSFNQAPATAS